jgi:hypothetical protein
MAPRRDVVCTICGLVACAHLTVLGVTDAAHPVQREARAAIDVAALPPEPDHHHRAYDGSVRIQLNEMAVSGTSSGAPPFVPFTSNREPRWPRDSWHPAYYASRFVSSPPFMLTSGSTSSSSG